MHRALVVRRVLVLCGAGASSSFLVHWMRKVAATRGLDIAFVAGSQSDLGRRLPELDAVLVGTHLSEAFPQLEVDAAAAGVPALLLPAVGFDAAGASVALGLLEELLAASAGDHAAVTDRSAVAGGRDNPGSSHG
jgi:PTS system cellobiose-specific IIB component